MNETTVASRANDGMDRMGSGSLWYAWDVILLGLLFAYGTFGNSFPLFSYIGGLRNDGTLLFRIVVWFIIFLPLPGICFLALIARVTVHWPRHIAGRKQLLVLQIVALIGPLAYLGLPFTWIGPPGYMTYTRGFRRYVQTNVDVPALRAWLGTVDPNIYGGVPIVVKVDEDGNVKPMSVNTGEAVKLPGVVLRLRPHYVRVLVEEGRRPAVRLTWGSGWLGTWGLTVGHEEMEIPETQLRTKEILPGGRVIFNDGEYRLPLAPGAYVWHNIELSDGARMPAND